MISTSSSSWRAVTWCFLQVSGRGFQRTKTFQMWGVEPYANMRAQAEHSVDAHSQYVSPSLWKLHNSHAIPCPGNLFHDARQWACWWRLASDVAYKHDKNDCMRLYASFAQSGFVDILHLGSDQLRCELALVYRTCVACSTQRTCFNIWDGDGHNRHRLYRQPTFDV